MSSPTALGLTRISSADLLSLLNDLEGGRLACPLTESALVLRHQSHLWAHCGLLANLNAEAAIAVISSVLAERNHAIYPRLDLVWTGPESAVSHSRDTSIVVEELFRKAQNHVLVGEYSFDHGADILLPLHAAMRDRGVRAELFFDLGSLADSPDNVGTHALNKKQQFLKHNWPFGLPNPTLRYTPLGATKGQWASMHAKCMVVDERFTLITSANFTNRGQTRNIEAGVLIDSPAFAQEFLAHWARLVELGIFKEA